MMSSAPDDSARPIGCAEFEQVFERLDAIGRVLTRISGLERQITALRLEVQSWKATQDADTFEVLTRIDQLETAIDKDHQ